MSGHYGNGHEQKSLPKHGTSGFKLFLSRQILNTHEQCGFCAHPKMGKMLVDFGDP